MRLYSWSVAPNPRRVAIFLAEKNLSLETVDVADSEAWSAVDNAYLDRFPHRRVPLLELDDGTAIGETPAICRYLEGLHPDPPLMGRNPRECAAVDMWDRFAEWDGMMAAGEVYWNTSKAFAGRGLPGYGDALAQIPALAGRGRIRIMAFYEQLDDRLRGRDFIATEEFTLADITAVCAIGFAGLRAMGVPSGCPAVARWLERVSERPSVRGTAPHQGDTVPVGR